VYGLRQSSQPGSAAIIVVALLITINAIAICSATGIAGDYHGFVTNAKQKSGVRSNGINGLGES
jgi:hypothetical protein